LSAVLIPTPLLGPRESVVSPLWSKAAIVTVCAIRSANLSAQAQLKCTGHRPTMYRALYVHVAAAGSMMVMIADGQDRRIGLAAHFKRETQKPKIAEATRLARFSSLASDLRVTCNCNYIVHRTCALWPIADSSQLATSGTEERSNLTRRSQQHVSCC